MDYFPSYQKYSFSVHQANQSIFQLMSHYVVLLYKMQLSGFKKPASTIFFFQIMVCLRNQQKVTELKQNAGNVFTQRNTHMQLLKLSSRVNKMRR